MRGGKKTFVCTVWEAAVLVLLMGVIEMASDGTIYIPSFMKTG
jgi:hypothetical protein